jgi:hypothetical protein
MVDSTRRRIPPAVADDDGPSDGAAVDHVTAPEMTAFVLRPPIFYQNKLGAVTNRRQARLYYEANSLRPTGPYVWSRY